MVNPRRDYDPNDASAAFADFWKTCPAYQKTEFDELRLREYVRLDELDQVYLDYTGSGLYAESQIQQHLDLLINSIHLRVMGDPMVVIVQ